MSTLPSAGPIILTVPGLTNVAIAAQIATTPGLSPVVKFTWPRPYVVSGFWLNTRDADPVALAALGVRLIDSDQSEIFSDGFGGADNFFGLAGSLMGTAARVGILGSSGRWQPFRRVVRGGDKWTMQLQNRSAAIITPWFGFKVEQQNNG